MQWMTISMRKTVAFLVIVLSQCCTLGMTKHVSFATLSHGPKLISTMAATNDSKHCDPTSPNGCTRCAPKPSLVCCDLCHPNHLTRFDPASKTLNVRASQRSFIKPFKLTSSDTDLKTALLNWRREQAITKFGNVLVRTYGPNIFMSDEIIERIVVCVHGDKLKKAAHILKETHWCEDRIHDHAESLLALIKTHSKPPSASTSTQESSSATPNVQKQQGSPPKCSRCKQEGHICVFIF